MATTTKLTLAKHRKNLEALRAETERRVEILQRGYDELIEAGDDVGAGEDEGGSEADGSFVERDRLRAQVVRRALGARGRARLPWSGASPAPGRTARCAAGRSAPSASTRFPLRTRA